MSSSSGLKLAETIKFVHRKLREEIKSGIDAETVWEQQIFIITYNFTIYDPPCAAPLKL